MFDVSKIVLTEEEQLIFNKFKQSDEAVLTFSEFQILIRKGLIKDCMDGKSGWFGDLPKSGNCVLSDRGKDLRAYQLQSDMKVRRQFRHDWKIAAFSSFAGALLSHPLWLGIDWLIAQLISLLSL